MTYRLHYTYTSDKNLVQSRSVPLFPSPKSSTKVRNTRGPSRPDKVVTARSNEKKRIRPVISRLGRQLTTPQLHRRPPEFSMEPEPPRPSLFVEGTEIMRKKKESHPKVQDHVPHPSLPTACFAGPTHTATSPSGQRSKPRKILRMGNMAVLLPLDVILIMIIVQELAGMVDHIWRRGMLFFT